MTVHSLSLTLVGCRLCNGKQEGKVFCSGTSQALGSLVSAPGSQGEYTAVKHGGVSGLSSDLPPWVWPLKKGKFTPERAPHLLSKILLEDDLPMAPPL